MSLIQILKRGRPVQNLVECHIKPQEDIASQNTYYMMCLKILRKHCMHTWFSNYRYFSFFFTMNNFNNVYNMKGM